MSKISLAIGAATIALSLGAFQIKADAASIFVSNPSFEVPTLSDGNFTISTPVPGWTGGGGRLGASSGVANLTPGPAYSSLNTLDSSSTDGSIGTMNGRNLLYFFNVPGQSVSQTLADSLVAGTAYTLTVAVSTGRDSQEARESDVRYGGYNIEFLSGSTTVASLASGSRPGPIGTFVDVQLTYTAQDTDPIGNLGIRLSPLIQTTDNRYYMDFDNVRLDAAPIPTPAPLLGLIGMGAAAIRKRKQETEKAA